MAGEGLKAMREAQGVTQQGLASKLGIHTSTVSAWEQGRNRPSRANVLLLEELLGLDGQLLTEFAYAGVTPFDAMRADLDQLADQVIRLTEHVLRLDSQIAELRKR